MNIHIIAPDETGPCPACGANVKLAALLPPYVPPYDEHAELAVLRVMCADSEGAGMAAETLTSDDFYFERHRVIFETLCDLYDAGRVPDLVVLLENLRRGGRLDAAGGESFVTGALSASGDFLRADGRLVANAPAHIEIVRDRAIARRLVEASLANIADAEELDDVREVLDRAELRVYRLASRSGAADVFPIKDLLQESFEELLKRRETPGLMTGLPTGFVELDELTGGWQKSDLVLLAGEPGAGTTALVHGFARHAAVTEKAPLLLFSPGLSRHHVSLRLLSSHCGLDYRKLRGGFVSDDALNDVINHGMGPLREAPLYVDDTQRIGVMELRAKARRMATHHEIALVVVDGLPLVRQPSQEGATFVVRALKDLARELNIPVIATAPVDPGIAAHELHAAGFPEHEADAVVFLRRDRAMDGAWKRETTLTVLKQRNGPTGSLTLAFDGPTLRFLPAARVSA